ncbi:hypothetical protein Vadar_003340 [Vaccinium darrowii]|uniref:Uncharacterized protein n=1 Tax=Vaccinium darrowii TaxID=229202 RepID=A0ACB7XF33_9ERIC|nr:hypothetical protein Vadar_003340 [Vaccinium darrowii]
MSVGMIPDGTTFFKASTGDYNTIFMKQILETYKGFKGLNLIVDVGGGHGAVHSIIVSKYRTIKGINFDLTPWILHSWDDENCLKILKNCYDSLPNNVKVIVVDMVIPETPETSVDVKSDFQFDLFLMNMNPGGKERTEREFESLAKEAGFSRVTACAFKFSLVEFYKTT